MSGNILSNERMPVEEVGFHGIEDFMALKELPASEIVQRLNPEVLRKIIDVVEYIKENLIGAKVDDLSLYDKIEADMEKKISFAHWLNNAIEEYREYQRLSLIGGGELEHWLGTPGASKIPKIQIKDDLEISDIARETLLSHLKKIFEEGISYTNSDVGSNQCTWWSIMTRPERVAYIAWIREIFETQKEYGKKMSERIVELNRKSEEERIRAPRAELGGAYFAAKNREYFEKINRERHTD